MHRSLMKSSLVKAAACLLGLLAAQSAWAIYPVDPGDKSHEYLRYIFGNVVNIIIDQDGPTDVDSILGAISQVLNLGMLAFTGFIIAYNALTGVLNSAREGVVMGKAHSTMWIPFRMVLALFFVFPWTAGYSTMQVAIIWLAGQGIGLANESWNASLDFIESSGSLYPPIIQLDEDAIALSLLESRVCMHGINYADGRANIVDKPIELVKGWGWFSDSIDPNELAIAERPPMKRVAQEFTSAEGWVATKASYLTSRLAGHPSGVPRYYGSNACGEMVLEFGEIDEGSGLRDAVIAFQDDVVRAYANLDSSLDPIARSIVAAKFIEGSPDPDYTTMNAVVQAFQADYENAILSLISNVATARVSKWADGNPDQVGSALGSRDAGWITAGAWYWDIQRINAETQALVSTGLKPEFEAPGSDVRDHDDYEQIYAAFTEYKENRTVIDSYTGAPTTAMATSSYSEDNMSLAIVSNAIHFALDRALAHPDPVSGLADLGRVIIGTLEGAYVGAWALSAKATALHEGTMTVPFSSVGAAATSLLKSGAGKLLGLITFIAVLLLPIALLLAFYLPATPLIIWILGIAGWFVLLIEAVFAAPLWAASHAMPEGDGFVGQRAQAGYLVMLSLLLRPILMLAGFFASMPLMIVMGKVTMLLFYPFMSAMIGDSLTGIVSFIGIMAVFTGLMIQIAHRAYGLIHEVPDKIFRFIGGGTENLGESSNEHGSRQVFVAGAANMGRSVKMPKPRSNTGAPASSTDKDLSKGT